MGSSTKYYIAIDKETSTTWLSRSGLKAETKSMITAA